MKKMQISKKKKDKIYDNTVKGLAVIGLGVLLAFIVWGTSTLVSKAPSVFSTINTGALTIQSQLFPEEKATLSLSRSEIASGETVKVFYSYNDEGNIQFSYNCTEDISVSIKANTSGFSQLNCDSKIYLDPQKSEFYIKASNTGDTSRPLELDLNISGKDISAQETVRVLPAETSTTENEEDTNQQSQDSSTATETEPEPIDTGEVAGEREDTVIPINNNNTSGEQKPDLTGEILKVGQGQSSNGTCEFVSTSTELRNGNQAAVRFLVENIGNTETGPWDLRVIPIYAPRPQEDGVINRKNQQSLAPGGQSWIEYTICFKPNIGKETEFTAIMDPGKGGGDDIKEINEDNNILKKEVTYTKEN